MDPLIDRFYSALSLDPSRFMIPRTQDLPGDMISEEPAAPPWAIWKPIPGRVSVAAMKEWQETSGWRLPEMFVKWFRARHTLAVDCGILRLACSPSNTPFADLEELLEWDLTPIRLKQLFPIGDEQLRGAGPLCLDLRGKDVEPPVVFWDGDGERVAGPVFSSFAKLLECAAFAMENDGSVLADPQAMERMVALDPEGAGRTGAAYWRGEDSEE